MMISSYNRIEISVKGDTCVLMGVKKVKVIYFEKLIKIR